MKRFLRTEVGERIDYPDFQYGIEKAPRDALGGLVDGFLVGERATTYAQNPKSFVLQGFTVRHAGGAVWSVEKDDHTGDGKAVMAFRENGEVHYGCVLVGGASKKQVDISPAGFPNATYGVYVRLEFRDEDYGNRLFWDATPATPVEYPRTIPTRVAEDWSVAFEQSSPGPEWMHIADVAKPGTTATDRRDFFFEGRNDASHLVVDAEWGDSDDRANFRATGGVFGFYRFVRAVQRLIQDIKADGVGWWVAPTFGLEELLDLTGTRLMAGPLNPDTTDTYSIGTSASFRWGNAYIRNIFAGDGSTLSFGIVPPVANTGIIGAEALPFGLGAFKDSLLSGSGGLARVFGGELQINEVAAGPKLVFNENSTATQSDALIGEIIVDAATGAFVQIRSGRGSFIGDNDIHLRGTQVKLSEICEGQNGIVYFNFQNASPLNVIAQTVTSQTTNITTPTSGSITTTDRIIGWTENGTGTANARAVDMYISATDQIVVDFMNPTGGNISTQPTFQVVVMRNV